MPEYIEREALLEKAQNERIRLGYDIVSVRDIESMPAEDVAPVRHGRWEPGNPICPVCGEDKFKDLDADIWSDWMPDFCPNCGAKMDGGAD